MTLASGSKVARLARRAVAIALGLVLGLTVIEGGLRAAGALVAPRQDPQKPLDFEPPWPEQPGERRVLCVGDSNTWGLHLAPRQSYPAQLAAILRDAPGKPWRVLNYGCAGRNSAEVRYHLVEQLARHRPDVVVVWGGVNTSWSRVMGHLWELPDREEPPGAADLVEQLRLVRMARVLLDVPAPGPHTRVPLLDERISEHLFFTRPGQLPMEALASGSGQVELMRRLQLDLTRIRALCDGAGARLLVLDYPYDVPHVVHSVNPAIAAFARDTGTPRLSLAEELHPRLERLGLERHLFPDWHLKPLATGEVARLVAESFASEGWVERGPWLERATLEELSHPMELVLEESAEGRALRVAGPPNARATLFVEPLVLRPGREFPAPMSQDERRRQPADPATTVELGTLRADGALTVPFELPPAPLGVGAPPDAPGTSFAGWRVRVATLVRRTSLDTPALFFSPDGGPISAPSRATLEALSAALRGGPESR